MEDLFFDQPRIFLQSPRSGDLFFGSVFHAVKIYLLQCPLYTLKWPFLRRVLTKILCSLLTCLKPRIFIKIGTIFIPNAPKLHLMQHMVTFLITLLHFFSGLSFRGEVPFLLKLISNFGLPHKAIKPAQLRHFFILFLFIQATIPKILVRILLGKNLCLVGNHFPESQLPLRPTNLIFILNR